MMTSVRWRYLSKMLKTTLAGLVLVLLQTLLVLKSPNNGIAYLHRPPERTSTFPDELEAMIVRNISWVEPIAGFSKQSKGFPSSSSETLVSSPLENGVGANQTNQFNQTYQTDRTSQFNSVNGTDVLLRETLEELLDVLSRRTYHCAKFVKIGGHYCNYLGDGEKGLCLDNGLSPNSNYCLVYSVGVGHDLTFDIMMDKFACEVYAFDSDRYHAHYQTWLTDRLTFYKARLGTSFLRQMQYRAEDLGSGPFEVEYWPLHGIMSRLGHWRHQLFYLKIDIEGEEWRVLEESIFKTDILEGTVQLSLEIHLEDLRFNGSTNSIQELQESAKRYLRILRGLRERGFQLAHWEPNYKGSELTTVAGLTFHAFSETLWVNPGHKRRFIGPSKKERPQKL